MVRWRSWRSSSLAVALAIAGGALAFAQAQAPPQFRAGVTLVEVQVRVLDKDGRPVTGLTADDFTIQENRIAHPVAHFRAVSLEDGRDQTTPGRTFVIVLGRGRLNKPTKALEALGNFVRSSTLPGDRISVITYHRVSQFTTDHARVARFLDLYRDRHERIDGLIAGHQRGSAVPVVGPSTRAEIEALLGADPELRFDDLPGGAGHAASRYENFRYLTTALRYLSTVEGEKHVVFVSQGVLPGLRMPHNPLDQYWVRLATSARSALWAIHAGGLPGQTLHRGTLSFRSGTITQFGGGGTLDFGAVVGAREIAGLTGGEATFLKYADQPLAALDRATRSYYVLGYYPTREVAPEEVRRIDVSVRQRNVTLQYRGAFQARPSLEEPSDFRKTLSDIRVSEAAGYLVTPFQSTLPPTMAIMLKWGMRLEVPERDNAPASGALRASVAFDPTWVTWLQDGADFITDFDMVLLADDDGRAVVGERRERVNVRISAADHKRTKREWLIYDTTVDVSARPAYLRAVLYDYETDRLASAQVRLR